MKNIRKIAVITVLMLLNTYLVSCNSSNVSEELSSSSISSSEEIQSISSETNSSSISSEIVQSIERDSSSSAISSSSKTTDDVSSESSNSANIPDGEAFLNPKTPGEINPSLSMSSSQAKKPETGESDDDRRVRLEGYVNDMAWYLQSNLSSDDYRLIYSTAQYSRLIHESTEPFLRIWMINSDAVNNVINSYTGEKCKIETMMASWSTEDELNLEQQIKAISLEPNEKLEFLDLEDQSGISVCVTKMAEERLTKEIDKLLESYGMPLEYVIIWTFGSGTTGSNPNTPYNPQ